MYNQTKHKERKHFCMYCLQCFSSEDVLNKQKNDCIVINGEKAIKMPQKGDNILKFNNYHNQLQVPFVISADFEAITEKVQSCKPNDDNHTLKLIKNIQIVVTVMNLSLDKFESFDLMSKKGIYSCDYMDSFENFNKTSSPNKNEFYSILNDEHMTDEQSKHAKKVWKGFKLQNMGEYIS